MRVLIFHGYLLRGTGSNVYNANLAAALVRLGHEVHLLCQDRDAAALGFVDAAGDWDSGELRFSGEPHGARCTVYRPDIGGLLPVYVADRYAAIEARPFAELDDGELDRYLGSNVGAVNEVVRLAHPDLALANHLVMGPAILSRALAGQVPYAVKVHGSALEYTVKPHPRFLPYAREGLAGARTVLVGSRHTAESLWAALDDPELPARTRLGPPGVDIRAFAPVAQSTADARLRALAGRLASAPAAVGDPDSAFARDEAAAGAALKRLDLAHDRLVAFVGKLIVSKGVDLLLAAWPLVTVAEPRARLVMIGFGAYREGAEQLVRALASGDIFMVRELADRGRAAEGGPRRRLEYLTAFLDRLEDDRSLRSSYFAAAAALGDRVVFTGRLEHDELAGVLTACEAIVVPSTFPEAFGMVAAEAAACGVLPISAAHSGLAEVTRELARAAPAATRGLLSFDLGPDAVFDLAARVSGWLGAPDAARRQTREALVRVAGERYSWEGVARGVIAAAEGRLEDLAAPV